MIVSLCAVSCDFINSVLDDIKGSEAEDTQSVIYLSFEYNNDAEPLTWQRDDRVSVFNGSNGNSCWEYDSHTDEGVATFVEQRVVDGLDGLDCTVVAYPYSEQYSVVAAEQNINATIPALQSHTEPTRVMVASGTSDEFALRSVCGVVKLQLTGDKKIQKILFKGNNEEIIAGRMAVNYLDYTAAALAEGAVREITLDLGSGVVLSDEPALFTITIVPQSFENGFTVTAIYDDHTSEEQSVTEKIDIQVGLIRPVAFDLGNGSGSGGNDDGDGNDDSGSGDDNNSGTFTFDIADIPVTQIWYKSTDGQIVEPYADVFDEKIISNVYENGKGVITFEDFLDSIGQRAFFGCDRLMAVGIPKTVTSIGSFAFDGTKITDIVIPYGVTAIAEGAFNCCEYLHSIKLPDSVTSIGRVAFNGCSRLVNINLPPQLEQIDNQAFYGCAFTGITLPYGITKITPQAFSFCSHLKSIEFMGNVESIGYKAFDGCASLESITIPHTVTTIGNDAFMNCYALRSIELPYGVTVIDENTFYGCRSLQSVTLGDNVTTIKDDAFNGCTSLQRINIPYGVTTIGYQALYGCSSLATINLPNSITKIDTSAFSGCSALNGVEIPTSITTLSNNLFRDCTSLTAIKIPYAVTKIEGGVFQGCSALAQVELSDNITSIGNAAFYGCTSLTRVVLPRDISEVAQSTFYGCTKLEYVELPFGLKSIGKSAFRGCTALSTLKYEDNIETISDSAFYDCNSLKQIVLPEKLTTLGVNAFFQCKGLEMVTLQYNVTTIGKSAFAGCQSLTEVYCKPKTPPTLGTNAFSRNADGRKIYIHSGLIDTYKQAAVWSDYADSFAPADFY